MPMTPQQETNNSVSDEELEHEIAESNSTNILEELTVKCSEEKKGETDDNPEFLRPISTITNRSIAVTTSTSNNLNSRERCEGRITPPPSLISPLPATPAGSMTPVCMNY